MHFGTQYKGLTDKIAQLINECDERPAVEKALWENEKKYRTLVESLDKGIAIVQDGAIKESNRKLLDMLGCTHKEVFNSALSQFIHREDDDKVPDTDLRCMPANHDSFKALSCRGELQHKNGRKIKVDIQTAHISFQKRPALLLIISDRTRFQKLDSELLRARKLESIAALSGGIAHDYNNLLAVIMGNLSLTQSMIPEDSIISHLMDEAMEASKIAKELTQRLITFSKGGAPLRTTTTVSPLVKSAVEFTLSGSNVKCGFSLPENLWSVSVDRTQIGQAIHNLVINAREAMPNGGLVHVSAENVFLQTKMLKLEPGRYVRITIRDQGPGIPETVLERIFDPYFSTKEMGTQKGMGLGLSISLSIIQKHGGDIDVDSHKGTGATFQIYLPAENIKKDEALPREATPEKPSMRAPIPGNGRILVMDDEALVRELTHNILTHLGYTVEFAQNGEEALALYSAAKAENNPFDAVILDLTIRGGMGGKETFKELKAMDPDVKCIVSSGYSADPVMAEYDKHGFKGMVAKPYDIYELSKQLSSVITPH